MDSEITASLSVRRFFSAVLLCALLLSVFPPPSAHAAQPDTVRVGYMLLDHFQEGGPGEIKSGYGYDYLQAIRHYTGWNYEYIYGTCDELLTLLEEGKIDLLTHVAKTPQREQSLLFALEPQNQESHCLYVCGSRSSIHANDLSTLNGKRVGTIRGDVRTQLFQEWCLQQGIRCEIIEYLSEDPLHEDLHSGRLDAASVSRLSISTHPGDWRSILRFDDIPVYFAVSRSRPDLLEEINLAQAEILRLNEYYGAELQQKYLTDYTFHVPDLTASEWAWLENHGPLKVGYHTDLRPLAYTDENGNLNGLLKDYLDVMSQSYGLVFEPKPYANGIALHNALMQGQVDIIAPVGYTYGMAENSGVSISDPLTVEAMLTIFKGYQGTQKKDIYQRIAVLSDSVTEKDYAKRHYPNALLVQADSVQQAIEYVDSGIADCYLIRSSTYSWYKSRFPLLNELQFATLPEPNNVNMAIRTDEVALIPILNKGITLLSETDIHQSIIANSDVRKEVTLLTLIQENLFTFCIGILTLLLAIVLLFVIYRLRTEFRHAQQLKSAKDAAEKARLDAERANMAKSTFLTSMSHDIRTPMNAIIGMTTLASKHLNNPDYVRNCLSKVTLASNHLLTLINDVLDINKIESGNLTLTPTVFSLADSIMNLANIGRHQLQEKNHRFEIRIHNIRQEYLFADELRINQIFINLLSNAVKYTPANGCITIDVKQEPIPGFRDKIRLIYQIADTGIGMSQQFQSHMYELFAMANKHSQSASGSGVGLAICKQLVDLMEGTIHCQSQVNQGTTFTVTLDLPIAERLEENLMLPPMKLLLVDDDEIFLATASDTLRELGLSPDCVDSGEKAVRTVTQKYSEGKAYPLIIIDWKMPGMDGIETTRAIRTVVGPDVSIIVISAYASEDIRDAALAAGANGFINKPFFRSFAYQSIRQILGLHTPHTEQPETSHEKVHGMRVLVAEDNDLNWEIARELLQMYGITAHRAENGQHCLDLLAASGIGYYDAVLMDIQMPVMNGYEAAQAIRSHSRQDLRSLPIVAMTADAYTEDVLRCAEAGMNAHIPKPIDMERTLEILGQLRGK